MSPRTGRRPGEGDTRGQILDAARATFAENGYENATIRAVARSAGVDPALVHHYFGNKEELFVAAMELPVDPAMVVEQLLAEGTQDVGERLVRFFLTVWDSETNRRPLLALVRAAMSNERAATMMREFVSAEIFGRLTSAMEAGQPELRGALVGGQMVGLAMMRYVLRLEPVASASPDQLAAALGPNVQRFLTGDLSRADLPA